MLGHNNPPTELEMVQARLDEKERELDQALHQITKKPLPATIEDDKAAAEVTERIKCIKNIKKGIDDAHAEVKAPYLECGKKADAWKRAMLDIVSQQEQTASSVLAAFLAKKEAEERARQLELARIEREKAEALAQAAAKHQDAGIVDVASELMNDAIASEQLAERVDMNILHARPADLAKTRGKNSVASRKMQWVGRIESLTGLDLEKLRPYLKPEVLQVALNAYVKNGGRECAGAIIREEITGLNIR